VRGMCMDVVAIDGPAGAGKSTLAKNIADKLQYIHLDTGLTYRALTLKVIRKGVDPEDEARVVDLARRTRILLRADATLPARFRVLLDGEDVTDRLRTPEVGRAVSQVSIHPEVRRLMTEVQRRAAADVRGLVADGRDIGTVVFPDARHKFYLDASLEQRVLRHQRDMRQRGFGLGLDEVRAQVEGRDRIDSQRACAPLKPAPDAIVLDTTEFTPEQVVDKVLWLIQRAGD